MEWRRLDIDGIDDLLDRGVYYGAGRSEAARCGDDDVVVVGAGNSAGQAVMNLADAGARVRLIVRGDSLRKSMSAYLVQRIEAHPLVEVRLRTELAAVEAEDGRLCAVTVRDAEGRAQRLPARALFLCIGGVPRTGWAEGERRARRPCAATSSRALTCSSAASARRAGRWTATRSRWRRACPACSRPATSATARSSASAPPSGDGAMAVALVHRRLEELARSG